MVVVFSGNCGRSLYHFRIPVVKKLQQLGHKVIAVLPPDEYTDIIRAEQVEVVLLKNMKPSSKNLFHDIKLYKEYISIYRSISPDIIFEYTIKPHIFSTLASRKLNIPCIAIVSGLGYSFTHKTTATFLLRKLYKFGVKKANQVWFSNNSDKEVFEELGFVRKENSLLLNGEGIDTNYYTFNEPNTAERSFLFSGRLLYDKGIEIYFKAAQILKAKYPEVKFSILGFVNNDDPRSVAEEILQSWHQSGVVEYLGSTKNIKPYVKNCTCFVLPSFYKEGMSTALMEAASIGRPLIASNIPGCKELVDHEKTGYICTPKSVEDLAAQMEKIILLSNDEILQMGKCSRNKMINEFDFKNIYPKYENAVNSI